MDFAIRLDQPDLRQPGASRSLSFGAAELPRIVILNGKGSGFEGGSDTTDLSLKWLPMGAAENRSEGRSYCVTGHTQLMLNHGQPYRLRMIGASESFVLFYPKPLADAAWQSTSNDGKALPEIPTAAAASPPALQRRLEILREESRRDRPDVEGLSELSLAVLTELVSVAARRRGLQERVPALRRATHDELLRRLLRAEDYLNDAGTNANLSGAARAAALSPFHLIRLFDAVFGETPMARAAGRRLDRAHEALVRSQAPVADIAEAAGYQSRTAFDRAFVKRFRITPSGVRSA